MPKETKAPMSRDHDWNTAPYPQSSTSNSTTRIAAIWSAADDEVLLRARASGLNWQPIATRHFPNKTANACRKRHERLIERRHAEDWDAQKLELLAREYMACRKDMWETLAARMGERWNVVEAKCLEKGLKTLQSTARTAHRRASASNSASFIEEQGNSDHNSDSGIGLGSDAEMEVGEDAAPSETARPVWSAAHTFPQQAQAIFAEHIRSRSLPQPLPLYKPPPPVTQHRRTFDGVHTTPTTTEYTGGSSAYSASTARYSPGSQHRGISIQSVLAPTEPQQA